MTGLLPVSVKGIMIENGQVWLRKNERNEWELPGGRLEIGEQPEDTLRRELREELGASVTPQSIVDVAVYQPNSSANLDEQRGILLVIYRCQLLSRSGEFEHDGEAGPAEFQAFSWAELDELPLPTVYRQAIRVVFTS